MLKYTVPRFTPEGEVDCLFELLIQPWILTSFQTYVEEQTNYDFDFAIQVVNLAA